MQSVNIHYCIVFLVFKILSFSDGGWVGGGVYLDTAKLRLFDLLERALK